MKVKADGRISNAILSALSSDVLEGKETVEKVLSDSVATALDMANTAYDYGQTALLAAEAATVKAVNSAVKQVMAGLLSVIKDKLSILNANSLLSTILGSDELLSIKFTSFNTYPYKALSTDLLEYRTTVDGMYDAVSNYFNRPSAKNSLYIGIFSAVPVGFAEYCVVQLKKMQKLMNDPVFYGSGLQDLFNPKKFINILEGIGSELTKSIWDLLTDPPIIKVGTPEVKRVSPYLVAAQFTKAIDGVSVLKGTSGALSDSELAELENEYMWRIQLKIDSNAVVPLNRQKKIAVKFSVVGGEPSIPLKFVQTKFVYRYDTPQTGMFKSVLPNDNAQLFLSGLWEGISNTGEGLSSVASYVSVALTTIDIDLHDIFSSEASYADILKYFREEGNELFIEVWEYENLDDEDIVSIVGLIDVRVVDFSSVEFDSAGMWYGADVSGLGSLFPLGSEIMGTIEDYLNNLLDTVLKIDKVINRTIRDLFNSLRSTLNQIMTLVEKIISLYNALLRALASLDMYYVVWEGDNTDIIDAWKLARYKLQVDEHIGRLSYTLIANVKDVFVDSIKNTAFDINSALEGNTEAAIVAGKADSSSIVNSVAPSMSTGVSVKNNAAFILEDAVGKSEIANSNLKTDRSLSQKIQGIPTKIKLPEYKK